MSSVNIVDLADAMIGELASEWGTILKKLKSGL
jgi:hypothetical protein